MFIHCMTMKLINHYSSQMKYCVHKDELVLNCGQPLHEEASILQTSTAYPSVARPAGSRWSWQVQKSRNSRRSTGAAGAASQASWSRRRNGSAAADAELGERAPAASAA